MKKQFFAILLVAVLTLLWSCNPQSSFKVNQTYNGFKLVEKKFVKEVNANCLYFVHEKSGAKLLKIEADDANKLFNIAFKTTPEHDYGTPHIMEHSVLNGSESFPVKSPFDILTKGSLNTFLNAMTGSDMTTYPVASMNEKDYFNLMHVYLDAVFKPLLHTDDKILKQEGWHYELDDVNGEIVYKGVVYNEMKGAFSSPERELGYQVDKALFPDNTYGVSSGGYPTAIPGLTLDYFRAFHKKYYHPSNSYILLYGDADLNKELEFIDTAYLSGYEKSEEKIEIPLQKPFEARKSLVKTYPVPEGSSVKDQTFLSYSVVIGKNTDQELGIALNILRRALVTHESAPLRLALQEANIGKDVSAYVDDIQQNVLHITVNNANPEDKDRFEEILFSTLKKVSEEGFDKETIDGIVNRYEFNMREGNTSNKGMMYLWRSMATTMFAGDPFLGLEFEAPLAAVKEGLQNGLLENIIKEQIIPNPHAVTMVLKPEPGLQNKLTAQVKKELADYKASLSKEQLEQLVAETKELKEHQMKEDAPEDVAKVPMLALSDISSDVEWYNLKEKSAGNVPVLFYEDFTNDILYTNLYFDVRALPQDLIPYANLLADLIGTLNTENYDFGSLDNALNIHTGGFYTYLNTYKENDDDSKLIPKFVVNSKATVDKADKLFELATEILNTTKYDDVDRLKDVLIRHQTQIESMVKNNGMGIAMTRLSSYYNNEGMFDELTNGIEYYKFITDIVNNFETKNKEVIENLAKTASILFNQKNMIANVTCSNDNYPSYEKGLKTFIASIPKGDGNLNEWKFDSDIKNEGLMSTSKVQYVVKGYDFKKLGYKWDGKMRVLNQILSREYLQTQVRVIGGAYGGFAGFSSSGNTYFASYRDPNLKETINNYDATPEFINTFEAEEQTMTRFIIGTIARMDRPTTASQRGSIAVSRFFTKETLEELKAERAAVLSTTPEDIKSFEKMVADILSQDAICVYGNSEKIKENKDLFKSTFNITE